MKKITVMLMICVIAAMFPLAGHTWDREFRVMSLYPLYTEADQVFLPELVGTWLDGDPDHWSTTTFNFERFDPGESNSSGDTHYILTVHGPTWGKGYGKSRLEARVLRFGDELFLDLVPSNDFLGSALEDEYFQPIVPVHSFGRIRIDEDVLRVSTLQACGIGSCSSERARELEKEFGLSLGETNLGLVLLAPTEQLQEFVLQHLDEYFSFEEDEFLRRVSPPQEGEGNKDKPDSTEVNQDEG